MSVTGSGRSGRRRSRVSDAVSESNHGSLYDDPAVDQESLERQSMRSDRQSLDMPPLPVKPPGSYNIDPRQAGNSADEYFHELTTTPSDDTPTTQALDRRHDRHSNGVSTSLGGLSHHGRSRRSRSHSTAHDLIRMLVSAEDRDSREALSLLRRTSERLEMEAQRANDAERRVQEATEKWRIINQARMQAQTDASRVNEELRLYKLQLEAAQSQIARANDMITQTDKEKALAEDEAAKARRLAKRYEMESMIRKAREEGRRLGREQGLKEGMDYGQWVIAQESIHRAQQEANSRRDPRDRYDPEYDQETFVDGETDGPEDGMPPHQFGPVPGMPPQGTPMLGGQQRQPQMPIPPMQRVPAQARSEATSATPRSRRFTLRRHNDQMDRNVEVNPSNAPDVATIVENEPLHTVTTPLLPSQTSQPNHITAPRMPSPNFNPDPSEVHPISMSNIPRSPGHPPIIVPPDGYIPRQDADGRIRIPPPHEHATQSPYASNSPLPEVENLPQFISEHQTPRELHVRDFAPQSTPGPSSSRPRRKHRYQKSVAESVDSTSTSKLSIISPPKREPPAMQPRLSAIPEYDGRFASPGGTMRHEDGFPSSPHHSRSPRHADYPSMGTPGMTPNMGRQSIVNDDPVVPLDMMNGAFSPRSARSGYSGPRRPAHITTPAPLASNVLGTPAYPPNGLGTPGLAYTRPRINSTTSSITGFGDVPPAHASPRVRGRDEGRGSIYSRSRHQSAANTVAGESPVPEITINPPSERSESLQSRTTIHTAKSPRMSSHNQTYPAPMSPVPTSSPQMRPGFIPTTPQNHMSPRITQSQSTPNPPPPVSLPGMRPGFVPTTPVVSEGPPVGFVPTTPVAPEGAPVGFVPTTPVGAPAGFVPRSPAGPEGPPVGFVPTSTSIPLNPLPEPYPTKSSAGSPNMSVTGALPVIAHRNYSTSGSSARSPRISFNGPDAGFHSRAASEWDTRSAWGENSPRPVRGPELYSRPVSPRAIDLSTQTVRPGSSLSRKSSGPVIPDTSTFQPSRASSSRRNSRVAFGGDPAAVPIPPSTAPSLSRSGRATSHGSAAGEFGAQIPGTPRPAVSRSMSARSDASRTRDRMYPYAAPAGTMPTPGTPAHPSITGMPPVGLGSPYSRRLDTHPEDDYENELVPSDGSIDSLTTPPAARRPLPGSGSGPSGRDSAYTRSPNRASLFMPPDPADRPVGGFTDPAPSLRNSASRQSIGSHKSYARFEPSDYVDPAILTSGRSALLPLPAVEPPAPVAGGKNKAKKNKKSKR